jgi:hypothetical protein
MLQLGRSLARIALIGALVFVVAAVAFMLLGVFVR